MAPDDVVSDEERVLGEHDDRRAVPAGPTWARLRAVIPSLHAGQQRVAEVFLTMDAVELSHVSAADVAARAGTSAATVVRMCQQLGFGGFRDFAVMMARDTLVASTAPDESVDPLGVDHLGHAALALRHAAAALDREALDRAAASIAGARRVLVAAHGWSSGAAATFALHLRGLGRSVDAPRDAYEQRVSAAHLTDRDICVVVCFTGSSSPSVDVARLARERDATVVLLSTFARSATSEYADVNLIFDSLDLRHPRPERMTASISQFAILQVLQLAVAHHLGHDDVDDARMRTASGVVNAGNDLPD